MLCHFYNEAMADRAQFLEQSFLGNLMRQMIYFPNDKTFMTHFDNALSKQFSLDLHCSYFVG